MGPISLQGSVKWLPDSIKTNIVLFVKIITIYPVCQDRNRPYCLISHQRIIAFAPISLWKQFDYRIVEI